MLSVGGFGVYGFGMLRFRALVLERGSFRK